MGPIAALRLLRVVNGLAAQLKKETAMKFSTNMILQVLGTVIQGANQISSFVPPDAKFWVAIGVAALQLVVAGIGHHSNPDGTPIVTVAKP